MPPPGVPVGCLRQRPATRPSSTASSAFSAEPSGAVVVCMQAETRPGTRTPCRRVTGWGPDRRGRPWDQGRGGGGPSKCGGGGAGREERVPCGPHRRLAVAIEHRGKQTVQPTGCPSPPCQTRSPPSPRSQGQSPLLYGRLVKSKRAAQLLLQVALSMTNSTTDNTDALIDGPGPRRAPQGGGAPRDPRPRRPWGGMVPRCGGQRAFGSVMVFVVFGAILVAALGGGDIPSPRYPDDAIC